jgi:2-octaprenyl-6-methoxyphenol hydroxylase
LAEGSRRILDAIGAWDDIKPHATPIREIHVSQRGRFGTVRLHASDYGVPALGYVACNRDIGAALSARLAKCANVSYISPARAVGLTLGADSNALELDCDGKPATVRGRLLIAADGARSWLRGRLGIDARVWDYGQTAVIANVSVQNAHRGRAFERFTDTGPLALLPLDDDRMALVWTVRSDEVDTLLALDDECFLAGLQERFGHRLGRFLRVGKRAAYPLSLVRAAEQAAERTVVIGNAAHSLHPIAGQGFNLSLRDVAVLADVLADALAAGEDPGSEATLARYVEWRSGDQRGTIAFTDVLNRVFANPLAPVAAVREAGLLVTGLLPPLRDTLAMHTMGLAGRLPRLAQGRGLR